MEKKQTAIDWLVEQYCSENYNNQVFEQAKQIEKEQMKFMFDCGRNFQLTGEGTFEEIYNETFKPE